ncbi:2-C-methyl-D-erythritol 4-phosphate cytidylyltransferase [Roseibacillus persicicus]|uniref:2-C-methyl-D-erythritol 4-phosphate cytidylyltransferase n=1 Tax=Roseibacillus persicicus TaxID=454148 RepID=UPI00398B0131
MTTAIIVASGSSRRMGFDKLMAPLAGKPVLAHSLAAFDRCQEVGQIIVVTDEARFNSLDLSGLRNHVLRVDGGKERQDSVANGLAALSPDCDIVAIHDGARPLISTESILLALDAAAVHGSSALAHPITETLKRADGDDFVKDSVSREDLWAMETPQCFRVRLLRAAYQEVAKDGLHVTDEVSALQHLGHAIKLVSNPSPNPKVTFPSDLILAEQLLAAAALSSHPAK